MSGGICSWLTQSVPYPTPLPLSDLLVDGRLVCSFQKVDIGYFLWPSDVEDVAQASVDEGLEFVVYDFCGTPGLGSI